MNLFTKRYLLVLVLVAACGTAMSQVKIGDNPGTINANSLLELEATDLGFVPPRVSLDDASTPAPLLAGLETGTLIYNLGGAEPDGYYYWDGTKWVPISTDEPWREETTGNAAKNGTTTDMYYTAGNVGIGNATPNDQLDVVGISHLNGLLFVGGKTTSNENGLKIHTDGVDNFIDSRIPASGFTYFRADNTDGTSTRLALDNTSGFFGVGYTSGQLKAPLDVFGIAHIRQGGTFATNPGLHLMSNVVDAGANSVELISDHNSATTGKAGFAWYTTLLNVPTKIMSIDSAGILNLENYGSGEFHFDSTDIGADDIQYLVGVQSDGDVVETPNLKFSYFEGDIAGFSSVSATAVNIEASETQDFGNHFNDATDTYTVPYDGLYLLKLNGRASAVAATEIKLKIGVNATNDGTEFFYALQSGVASSVGLTQYVELSQGDQIRAFVDTGIGTTFTISRGYWSIICVQPF